MAVPVVYRALSAADLDFIIDASAAELPTRGELERLLLGSEAFRREVLGDERLFAQLMASEEAFARVSPRLFFEVLLRHAVWDMGRLAHTVDWAGTQRIPVFDAGDVVHLLESPDVVVYLAGMLASFMRVESYTQRVWVRRGIVRKVRYSDMDPHSLLRLAEHADEAERLPLYQRIADLCLLVLGVFPDSAAAAYRYPSGGLRPRNPLRPRLSTDEYEALGQRMYGLAAVQPAAAERGLTGLFRLLSERIIEAKKPLSFISEHYLGFRRQRFFGSGGFAQ